jgi:beta-glucosidase
MSSKLNHRRGNSPICKNSSSSPADRVKDLLRRMTFDEKVARSIAVWQEKAQKLVGAQGNFEPSKL